MKFFRWLPVAAWVGLIFLLSTGIGAEQRTSRFLGPLIRWVFPGIRTENAHALQACIRKFAHVAEYAVLALLLAWAHGLAGAGAPRLRFKSLAAVVAACAIVAALDELHQLGSSDRTGQAGDVLIDTIGAVIGVLSLLLWRRWGVGQANAHTQPLASGNNHRG